MSQNAMRLHWTAGEVDTAARHHAVDPPRLRRPRRGGTAGSITSRAPTSPASSRSPMPCWPRASCNGCADRQPRPEDKAPSDRPAGLLLCGFPRQSTTSSSPPPPDRACGSSPGSDHGLSVPHGVLDHLRVAAEHDPRIPGVSCRSAARSSSPFSISVVMRPCSAPGTRSRVTTGRYSSFAPRPSGSRAEAVRRSAADRPVRARTL